MHVCSVLFVCTKCLCGLACASAVCTEQVQSGACAQYVCKCVHVTALENDIHNVTLSGENIKQVLTCMLKF